MGGSVVAAAEALGLSDDEVDLIGYAHALAMVPRIATLDDDHHPAYLHPGRTALVLLRDVGPLPVEALVVAAVHEGIDDDLRVRHDVVAVELGEAVAELVESLPLPGDERLAERLVTLDEVFLLATLAEHLDHLRHAHLRGDLDWQGLHDEASSVWVPVAERAHPRLADRYQHWYRTFARRLA